MLNSRSTSSNIERLRWRLTCISSNSLSCCWRWPRPKRSSTSKMEKPVAAYPFPDFHGSRSVRRVRVVNRGKDKLLLLFLSLVSLSPATAPDCTTLQRHGKLDEARKCYSTLPNTCDPYTRAQA